MDKLWTIFARTGKVEDYLRYRNAVSSPSKEDPDAPDNRRTDHSSDRQRWRG